MSLQKLSPSTTRRLSSAQVVTSVCDAVKELVENALDSVASTITVKLVNYGLDRIEVKDDGCGVPVSNVEFMCRPHYTSKINEFSDLGNKLVTYGFRGEGLASLCNVADVVITTRTEDDEYASEYTFDKNGKVLERQLSHFRKGTTVVVLNIFNNMPVRKKFITSSHKSKAEFKKIEIMVKNFALINTGICVSFWHNKSMVWQKSPAQTLKESTMNVLGYTFSSMLEEISTSCKKSTIVLLLPKKDCKGLASLCFSNVEVIRIFINKRPVKYTKIQKIILNNVAEYFGTNYPQGRYPSCIVDIKVESSDVDVNVEANKTKVLLHEEDEIFSAVEKLFKLYYKISDEQNVARQSEFVKQIDKRPTSIKEKQIVDNRSENIQCSALDQERIHNTDIVQNLQLLEQCAFPVTANKDLWPSADNAMSLWSSNAVKSASGDIVQDKSLNNEEKKYNNESSEEQKFAKKPRLNNDFQSACFKFKQAIKVPENVNDLVVDEQRMSKIEGENDHNYFEKLELSAPTDKDLWAQADRAMGFWSRGTVKSTSGNIIQGGTVLLQPKHCSNNGETFIKKVQNTPSTATTTCALNLEHTQKQNIQFEKLDSSFHSVPSQMGCKKKSGFNNFCQNIRPKILQESPGMPFTTVAKILSAKWEKLTDAEKCIYKKVGSPRSVVFNKSQNKSILDMFENNAQCCVKKCTTWNMNVDFWKKQLLPEINNRMMPTKLELLQLLQPEGLGICKKGLDVCVIRFTCLLEMVVYKQLIENNAVPVIPLDKPLLIKREDLNLTLWQCLTLMTVEQRSTDTFELICPIITKNGFRLQRRNGELLITHVASTIKYYGIEELKEILHLSSNSTCISQCRPKKVTAYFENEAVRRSYQMMNKEKIPELLELWSRNEIDELCLHNKPILKYLYKVPQGEVLR